MTDANTTTVNVPAEFIAAALQAVSKEETRYYLKGVFLDARGFVASTNGHIAFAARCTDAIRLADCRPAYDSAGNCIAGVIVPHDALLQADKAAGRTKGMFYVFERDAAGLWWILYGNARVHFQPIDGSFPDWTRVVPETPETETAAHYQPQYIAAMGNMAKALRDGKKDSACLYHIHQAGEGPALVTFPRAVTSASDAVGPRVDCCAVILPMRAYKGAQQRFDTAAFLNL